ncbi:MAG TPA: pitrilysin family protein [Candidatus Omnitrophota bacterium]|nr:pitrilysin family protein [Candidatus Omnitrophota bacterium]HRZ14986.1 pitrilysin family protein [Candidatus Omnitrophota bacterium]
MYSKTIVGNGVRVISCPMKDRQSLAVGIWVAVGSRYENQRNAGISHYLEHMVFKGTEHFTCQQIKESIEGVGGSFNGFTSEEITCYFVKMPGRYLDLSLDILSDMVLYPQLKQKDVLKERTVILEEIKMYKDQPQSHVYELLDKLLWPAHPLGMSTLGTEESVSAVTRADLAAYQKQNYAPKNIVVSVAGSIDPVLLSRKVARRFSGLPASDTLAALPVIGRQSKAQVTLVSKDTEQSHMVIGFPGLHRDHPLKHALGLLHISLGANSSSRLFNEVREKRGLAYEIGTHVKFLKDTGAFIVHAGVDNRKVKDTIRLVFKELGKTTRSVLSRAELKRAREFYLGQLTLALEDTMDQMMWIGESTVSLDRTYTLKQVINEVQRVTPEDIREVSRLLFRSNMANLALIGPLREHERTMLEWMVL